MKTRTSPKYDGPSCEAHDQPASCSSRGHRRDLVSQRRRLSLVGEKVAERLRRWQSGTRAQDARLIRLLATTIFSQTSARRLLRDAGIGDNGYNSRFRKVSGRTLGSFMREVRLRSAARLLRDCPLIAIWRIGQSIGYSWPASFTRAFKKRFECTPRQYRAACCQNGGRE